MRITLRTWLFVAMATVLGPSCARAQECGELIPEPNVLDPDRRDAFPMEAFEKKLRNADTGVKEWLGAAEENVKAILLEEEAKRAKGEYPTCYYQDACPSTAIIAQYWYVTGSKKDCWLVEPVIWINCDSDAPSYTCGARDDGAVGRSCRQRYTMQTVWVFCEKGSDLKTMTVPIATSCIATTNWC